MDFYGLMFHQLINQIRLFCHYSLKEKKKIAQQVQVAETVQHTRPLLFLFQSQETRFFWHALSGKAPVGILPSKSQQQARCDKVDVEPSDVFISAFTHNH